MQVEGRVFVIAGAGSGMGREVALELLNAGARVAAVDLNRDALAATKKIAEESVRLSTHACNVVDIAAVDALVSEVIDAHGAVDGLINIAGIIHRFAPSKELEPAEAQRVFDVNFWGTVNTCRAFLPLLLERPRAALVNMSSLSALIAFAGQTVYGASKGAVKQYTEGLYQELASTPVRVSAIYPGNISTDIAANSGVRMIDSGGKKVRATSPRQAAIEIVRGIQRGRMRILVGNDAKTLDLLVRISPQWTTGFIGRQMASVL